MDTSNNEPATTLSKRELYAALALLGLISNRRSVEATDTVLASIAVAFADALIDALEGSDGDDILS